MSNNHTRLFTVRHYECDAYGHLNNAVYLQYMQEAAINASTASGLDREEYRRMGRIWLIRASEVEYLAEARAGDQVQVDTWVSGFRRTMSRREYQMQRRSDGMKIAQGSTDWVFLDSTSMRPSNIPQNVRQAFIDNPDTSFDHERIHLQDPSHPPEGTFSIERGIEWRDIDEMHHLNNAAYLSYAEDCAMQLSDAYGWPFKRWAEDGVAFVARKNRIEYLQSAHVDDRIKIRTWLFNVRGATATRHYQFIRAADDEVLARLQTDWVFINLDTGRPSRFPPEFKTLIADNIAS
jgi:acyl-CoA thioester hydrolase